MDSKPTAEQAAISAAEIKAGKGTKTDAGKIEPHLLPFGTFRNWLSWVNISENLERMGLLGHLKGYKYRNDHLHNIIKSYLITLTEIQAFFEVDPEDSTMFDDSHFRKICPEILQLKTHLALVDLDIYEEPVADQKNSIYNALGKAIEDEIAVYTFGKYKYSANNWHKVEPPIRYFDAAGRHLLHIMKDKSNNPINNIIDADSGLPTIAHMQCDLSFFHELLFVRNIMPYTNYNEWVEREKISRGLIIKVPDGAIIKNDSKHKIGKHNTAGYFCPDWIK